MAIQGSMELWSVIGGLMFCLGIAVLLVGIWVESIIVALMGIALTFSGFAVGVLFGDWEMAGR